MDAINSTDNASSILRMMYMMKLAARNDSSASTSAGDQGCSSDGNSSGAVDANFTSSSLGMNNDILSLLMQNQNVMQTGTGGQSGSGNDPSKDVFSLIDSDGDGKLSQSEFVSARPDSMDESTATALFKKIDSEGTGSISQDQFAQMMREAGPPPGPPPGGMAGGKNDSKLDQLFSSLDADGDGTISQSEMETALSNSDKTKVDSVFSQLDADGNGSISTDELKSGVKQAMAGHHHHDKTASDDTSLDQIFSSLDTNGDGTVSQSEMEASLSNSNKTSVDSVFSQLDADGNGSISQAELKDGIKQAMANDRPPPPPPTASNDTSFQDYFTANSTSSTGATTASSLTASSLANADAFMKAIQSYLYAQHIDTDLTSQLTSVSA